MVGFAPDADQISALGDAAFEELGPAGRGGDKGVRLVHEAGDGDAHGGSTFTSVRWFKCRRGKGLRGVRVVGRLVTDGEFGSGEQFSVLVLRGESAVEDAGGQERAFDRVAGLAGVDHAFEGVQQVAEVGEVGLVAFLDAGGEGLRLAFNFHGDGDIAGSASEHGDRALEAVEVVKEEESGFFVSAFAGIWSQLGDARRFGAFEGGGQEGGIDAAVVEGVGHVRAGEALDGLDADLATSAAFDQRLVKLERVDAVDVEPGVANGEGGVDRGVQGKRRPRGRGSSAAERSRP